MTFRCRLFITLFNLCTFRVNEDVCNELKDSLKKSYDYTKQQEIKALKSNALPKLIVKNFDIEQIWQQIELQNDTVLTRSLTNVSKLIVGKNRLVFNKENKNDQEEETENDSVELNKGDSSLDENNKEEELGSDRSDSPSNIEEDLEDMSDESEEEPPQIDKTTKSSIVDDDFFKLDEMEQFLNSEEKKLNDPDSGNDSDENSDEESIDLFEAQDDENEDEDAVKTAKFKDFFVKKDEIKKPRRNKFLQDMQDEEDQNEDEAENHKSTFEQRQDRLNKRIEEIEENAIQEKPWQLKGEITAEGRPQNSLLEEVVEFDLSTRPAPVITEQTTLQLEDIIRQRIKDKVFDSVQRKAKPIETPLEYKKKLVLDQEKSKQSLAQIYEKEYLDQKAALDPENADKDPEEPALHKEINTLMSNLFSKLDALSNYHFTPKPAIPELKIISNLPAINMEEVAPVGTSDAALLAPEEVKGKAKGDLMSKNERTDTDKKRERRKKKLKQKMHSKLKEKKLAQQMNNKKAGAGKYANQKEIDQKLMKNKNVDKVCTFLL